MTKEIKFGDDEWAFIEGIWNMPEEKIEEWEKVKVIDFYLSHVKAWIEVINNSKDKTVEEKKSVDKIYETYNLDDIEIESSAVKHFQNKTNNNILNMIWVVLTNHHFVNKK